MADESPIEVAPRPAPLHLFSATDLAPTIFVDGLEGFAYNDNVVKINIFQDVLARPGSSDRSDNIERRVAAHLVIPHKVLDQIHDWLGRQLADRNHYFGQLAERTSAETSTPEQA